MFLICEFIGCYIKLFLGDAKGNDFVEWPKKKKKKKEKQ